MQVPDTLNAWPALSALAAYLQLKLCSFNGRGRLEQNCPQHEMGLNYFPKGPRNFTKIEMVFGP